jgi:hypothetical protein
LIYRAIETIGGLELEDDYPYKAKKQKCSFNTTKVHVKVTGAVDLPKGDEIAIQKYLVANGPVRIFTAVFFYKFFTTVLFRSRLDLTPMQCNFIAG